MMDSTGQNDSNLTQDENILHQVVDDNVTHGNNSETVSIQATEQEKQSVELETSMTKNQDPVENSNNKKKNKKSIGIIIIVIIVLVVGGVIATLFLTGAISFDNFFNSSMPTPELAKSVCDKYGGRYTLVDTPEEHHLSVHYCESANKVDNLEALFSYEIDFLSDSRASESKDKVEGALLGSAFTVLENSEDFIKMYSPISDSRYIFVALYKNVAVELQTTDASFGDNLLVELGFPDKGRKDSYRGVIDQGSDVSNSILRDSKYRDILSSLASLMNRYLSNNRGQLPEISNGKLVDFDSYLDTVDFVNEATGNKYELVAYDSFADSKYAMNESLLNNTPSDVINVFYHANCENNKINTADNQRRVVFVHSNSSNDGYFCAGN